MNRILHSAGLVLMLGLTVLTTTVKADDTEIYVSTQSDENPNVIFIMDTSGSMGYSAYSDDGDYEGSRLEVVQEVAVDVINSTSNINIAIMRFDRKSSSGGWLSSPMLPIEQEGVRSLVHDVLYSYTAAGGTPITETLLEAGAYLRGDSIVFDTALNTENTDLCMTWEEQLVPVSTTKSTTSSSTISRSISTSTTTTAASSTSEWWFVVAQENPWLLASKLVDGDEWTPWSDLKNWIQKDLQELGITKSTYGSGSPEWWMVTAGWFYDEFRNPDTGEFTLWDSLPNWVKENLIGYGITESTYRSNTESSSDDDDDDDASDDDDDTGDTEYTTELVCIEYLNLDDAHDGKGNWTSPITDECQSNHIVLFSDGSPTQDNEGNTIIKSMLNTLPSADFPDDTYFSTSCSGHGGCAEELAYTLYNDDNSDDLDGTQSITVHTIGGFIGGRDQDRMDDMALYGGGIAQEGSSSDELREALTKVFDSISSTSGTYSSPSLSVNAYNSLEDLDQLYYSVFQPDVSTHWSGNIKRYELGSDGSVLDQDGQSAIDSTSGVFTDDAISFWTLSEDSPDGNEVELGGIARRLTEPDNRKVATYFGGTKNLSNSSNLITTSNANITTDLFSSDLDDDDLDTMIYWVQGYSENSSGVKTARRAMEDPLHSRPVLVNYGTLTSSSGESVPDSTLYVGTNSGYLHAFNTNEDDPEEVFAFIPKELLPNTYAYMEEQTTRVYGMDGNITVNHTDTNGNNIVDSGETAYLYAGMRRGGRNYYALDISNRDKPKYLWQINGGDDDFEELGQSWSTMVLTTVFWRGSQTKVLVFGGGYDTAEDDNTSRTEHSVGNAIFMVDAESGELLWKASNDSGNLKLSDMTSGIVGDIVPVDDDADGDTDILYAADLGGRIWRIDFDDENSYSANNYAQGGMIADLGADDTAINNVRFYTTPDIIYSERGSFLNDDGSTDSLGRYQISIGSGYRAHPLNTVTEDAFYLINDFEVNGAPTRYTTLSKSDLANYAQYTSASNSKIKNGLYLSMTDSGEKVLSDAVTIDYVTYLVTYRPSTGESRSGCEPDIGDARLYTIEPFYYADATSSSADTTVTEPAVVTTELQQSGIAPSPVVVFPPSSDSDSGTSTSISVLIGGESVIPESSYERVIRNYWREY